MLMPRSRRSGMNVVSDSPSTGRRSLLVAATTYFGLVFGVGFVLGAIRVPFIVPLIGVRVAELAEMPLMFIAVYLAAGYVVRQHGHLDASRHWWTVGLTALGMLVLAELLLAVVLADRSLGEYLASRDPVSGAVYLAMLLVFAAMPRWRHRPTNLAATYVHETHGRRAAEVFLPTWALLATGGATVALFVGLAWYLAPLNPGVLALQLAFTPRTFGTIIHLWSPEHLARYRSHLPFDCLLLLAYGGFGYLLSTRTRLLAGLHRSLREGAAWILPLAAACDLLENGLHWWLTGAPRFGVPVVYAVAATGASVKWALLLVFGALCLRGALNGTARLVERVERG